MRETMGEVIEQKKFYIKETMRKEVRDIWNETEMHERLSIWECE